MNRLNSGIFRIFEIRGWNLNLISQYCRASKIIWNDTKLEPIIFPDSAYWPGIVGPNIPLGRVPDMLLYKVLPNKQNQNRVKGNIMANFLYLPTQERSYELFYNGHGVVQWRFDDTAKLVKAVRFKQILIAEWPSYLFLDNPFVNPFHW